MFVGVFRNHQGALLSEQLWRGPWLEAGLGVWLGAWFGVEVSWGDCVHSGVLGKGFG